MSFNERRRWRDADGAVLVEFHEGRTGTPHPPDDSTIRWEARFHAPPRANEGVTFPSGRHVVVTNVIHVLGQLRGEHYIVCDVTEEDRDG